MKIKCLIWDLDGTLWEGVLNEGEIHIRPGVMEVVAELDRRGILQTIASHNDPEQAAVKLRELELDKYFLHPQFNWGPKAESIRRLVRRFGFALESMAFIDDDPFQRFEAERYFPGMHVYPAEEYEEILSRPEFQPDVITRESGLRRRMMLAEAERAKAGASFAGPREDFLKSCEMKLTVRPGAGPDLDRIYELAARTTQLNNMPGLVDKSMVQAYLDGPKRAIYVAELTDRFGKYGIIGAACLDIAENEAETTLFCISCRIKGRGVAYVFLGETLGLLAKRHPRLERIHCRCRSDNRNRPALLLLQMMGFKPGEKTTAHTCYVLPLPASYARPAWLDVRIRA
ncbi:MAG: HAD-IIIC family phosphatase [Bacillota bacterium]